MTEAVATPTTPAPAAEWLPEHIAREQMELAIARMIDAVSLVGMVVGAAAPELEKDLSHVAGALRAAECRLGDASNDLFASALDMKLKV